MAASGDYAGRMTTFGNATTADFDRYAERSFDRDLSRYLAEQERAEAAHEWAVEEFGEDYEQNEREVEDRDLIPEGDVALVSEQDRADLAWVLDMEAWEGFGS